MITKKRKHPKGRAWQTNLETWLGTLKEKAWMSQSSKMRLSQTSLQTSSHMLKVSSMMIIKFKLKQTKAIASQRKDPPPRKTNLRSSSVMRAQKRLVLELSLSGKGCLPKKSHPKISRPKSNQQKRWLQKLKLKRMARVFNRKNLNKTQRRKKCR